MTERSDLEVLTERLNGWIVNTKDYRASLDKRLDEINLKLAFLNDRYLTQPQKCEERFTRRIWTTIGIILGIPSTILVILQILKWKI